MTLGSAGTVVMPLVLVSVGGQSIVCWVLGFKLGIFLTLVAVLCSSLQCFDTVGWATGRASGL